MRMQRRSADMLRSVVVNTARVGKRFPGMLANFRNGALR